MSVKIIKENKVDQFANVGFFPLIGKYIPGAIKDSMLPIPVKLQDAVSGNVYDCQLKTAFRFEFVIPEVISFMVANKTPMDLELELLQKFNVAHINHLGFYYYAFNR
jgi:hypothetical protein